MTTVGIRELKNHLSHYLRMVRAGETVVITDRGEIVAEINPPREAPSDFPYPELWRLGQEGRVRLGSGNDPDAYPPAPFRMPAGTGLRLLSEDRGEL
jgi:antitoxin (DNA-binding transcriptional repressor) of toxin-antitoxin stability system